MQKRVNIPICLILICLNLFSGCVGTVESGKNKTSASANKDIDTDMAFEGIVDLVPISDTKIEVYFPAATGGSLRYTYLIYVGNETEPIPVTDEVLEKDYRGYFRYTLQNLNIGNRYTVKVDVFDQETEGVVNTSIVLSEYTYSNYVSIFSGISSVRNAPGVDAIDSIIVRWPHAVIPGGIFDNGEKPQFYEITLIDSEKLTPEAFDDLDLGEADGKIVRSVQYDPLVIESTIRGLKENTTYYVNVRAIHEGSIYDPNDYTLRSETNHRYKEVTTLSQNAAQIQYDPLAFIVESNSGFASTNTLKATWGDISGVFDHLRIYYATNPNLVSVDTSTCVQGSSTELLSGDIFCKKINDVTKTSNFIGHLVAQTNYQAQLVICLNSFCDDAIFYPISYGKTESSLASFSGINEIILAEKQSELGTLGLKFTPLDLSEGYFDGLAIEFTKEKADLQAYLAGNAAKPTTYIITESESNEHPLTHDFFNYSKDSIVKVKGLDYAEGADYCFAMYPFNYDPSIVGGRAYYDSSAAWRCIVVKPVPPSKLDFVGLDQAETVDNDILLKWSVPIKGVYTHFEIFYKEAAGPTDASFDFNTAINDTTINFDFDTYERILISNDSGLDGAGNPIITTSHKIYNIADGYYIIGILTYANGGFAKTYRSESNIDIYRCHVQGNIIIEACQKI